MHDYGLLAELGRVAPIIAFLLTVTVVAELADRAGVFDVAGHHIAHLGRNRMLLLWIWFAGFAITCTVFLSLDTTAVLLTPVALAVAAQVGAPPRAFALTTLWIANTGSLLLPVSNLTNLLALGRFQRLGVDHIAYVRLAFVPGLVSIVGTLVVILVLHPGLLRSRYVVDPPLVEHDPVLLRVAAIVCLLVGPAFAVGLSPWMVSTAAAAVLAAATTRRAPDLMRRLPVPWLMAAGFAALTLLVSWAQRVGLLAWLDGVAGGGHGVTTLARIAGLTALAANAVNNLPAYLLVEPSVSDHPMRLMAALIGANAGPIVTPWGSLATLLWLQRCRSAGITWRLTRLAVGGAMCAATAVTGAILGLWLAH